MEGNMSRRSIFGAIVELMFGDTRSLEPIWEDGRPNPSGSDLYRSAQEEPDEDTLHTNKPKTNYLLDEETVRLIT